MPYRTVFSEGAARKTQMHLARQGELTPELERVATDGELEATLVRDEVARGRMIIPANVHHAALRRSSARCAARSSGPMHNFRDIDWDAPAAAARRRQEVMA